MKKYKNIGEYAKYLAAHDHTEDERAVVVHALLGQSYADKETYPVEMLPHVLIEFAKVHSLNAQDLLNLMRYLLNDVDYYEKISKMAKKLVELDIDTSRIITNDTTPLSYENKIN